MKLFMKDQDRRKNDLKKRINALLFSICHKQKTIDEVAELEKKLFGQKRFLNMVVHDMRNPCESIQHGLEHVQQVINQ